MKRIMNISSLPANTEQVNNQINRIRMVARARSKLIACGLVLLVAGAVALLLAGCADDGAGGTVPAKSDAPTVTAASDTELTISWSAVSDANQYRLYRSTTEDGEYTLIATVTNNTSYTDRSLTATTTYYYRLSACSGSANSSCSVQSVTLSAITRSPAPVAPTVTVTSDRILTISWSEVSNAAQYRLYRSDTENGIYIRIAPSATITAIRYTDRDLRARATYYYRLAFCTGAADDTCSVQSVATSATTLLTAPTVTVTSDTELAISWGPVSGATEYRLYRSNMENGTYTRIASGTTITATKYANSGLTAGTTYYYRLAACTGAANDTCSAQSAAVGQSTTRGGLTIPSVPAAPTITATSDTVLTASWVAVARATQYRLYQSDMENGTYMLVATSTSGDSYADSGLTAGTSYYYRLAACGGAADDTCSEQSVAASGRTLSLPTPSAPVITATSDTELVISWVLVSGATQYRLYRSNVENGAYTLVTTSMSGNSYADSGRTAGTIYHYRVAACGGSTHDTCSAQSAAARGRTNPSVPAAPTVTPRNHDSLTVRLSLVSGAMEYRLYRSNMENGTYTLVTTTSIGDYVDSGLTAGTTYYYRGAACGGSANDTCSEQSVAASGRTFPLRIVNAPAITATSDTELVISWGTAPGATQFRLYRSDMENGIYTRIASGTPIVTTNYADSSLTAGTTYYYRVAVCIGAADDTCSAQSAAAGQSTNRGGLTIPSVPAAPTITATSDTVLTILWVLVSDATEHRLYRSNMENGTYMLVTTSTSGNSYADSSLTVGTSYYYRLAACGGAADDTCSEQSVVASGRTRPLPAPAAPSVRTASDTSLTILWLPTSGATEYRLYQSDTENGVYVRFSPNIGIILGFAIGRGPLAAGSTYYYRIAACIGAADEDCSAQSAATSGRTFPLPIPAAPTVTAIGDTSLTISWSAASGATQYRLYRSFTSDGTYTRIASDTPINTISHTDSGLREGGIYYYRLAACTGVADEDCSPQSAAVVQSTTRGGVTVPAVPTVPTVAATSDTSLTISWSLVSDATRYHLYRSVTGGDTYTRIASDTPIAATATSYVDSGLTAGTDYHYRLAACTGNAESSCSAQSVAVVQVTTRGGVVVSAVPAVPTVTAASNTVITISWSVAVGATQYRLERSTAEAGTYTRIATVTSGISYTDTGLTPATAYYYRLSACASSAENSCSVQNSVANATTPADLTIISGAFTSDRNGFGIAGEGGPKTTHSLVVISNQLYMMATTIGTAFDAPQLYRLPGDNSKAIPVGVVGPSSGHEFNPQGMAAIGNTVYMVGSGKLYSMELDPNTNRLTAFATIVGTLEYSTSPSVVENEPRGLAAIGNTLYLVGGSTRALYTVSTTNGSLSKIGDLKENAVFLPSDRLTSAMTANDGTLYIALKSNADIDKAELYSVDPANAQATRISDITISGTSSEKMPTGLAVWNERLYLLGADGINLYLF